MSANIHLDLLPRVSVASPCTVDWNSMTGDDQTRHCDQCNFKVHNLSAMSRTEAEAFLQRAGEGRTCIRFFRRADGTIMTRDCPVGVAERRNRVARTIGRLAAALGIVAAGSAIASPAKDQGGLGGLQPFAWIRAWFAPVLPPPPKPATPSGVFRMGKLCAPSPKK